MRYIVVVTFICQAKIGLNLPIDIATWIGVAAMVISFIFFIVFGKKMPESEKDVDSNGWNINPARKPEKTANEVKPEQAK